jgi:endoglucanase
MNIKQSPLFIFLLLSLVFTCSMGPGTGDDLNWPAYPGTPAGPTAFIQADGRLLKYPDGSRFLCKGISFGNSVWSNPSSADQFTHHGPVDYRRIRDMGFNCVRFYINYGLFEKDSSPYNYKESGFEWLDRNIAAARTYGIYLILNMHYPQGGFQSNGDGDALWTNAGNRARLATLWRAIADRYKNEEYILGYGLINEPVVPENTSVDQWTTLSQNIINAIREVDQYHLIFVERVNWLKSNVSATQEQVDNLYFPLHLDDPGPGTNIVYEFHMYSPLAFTHQNASWVSSLVGQFAHYPDPDRIEAEGEAWEWFTDANPQAPAGDTNWTYYEGTLYQVNNADYEIGRPVVQVSSIGPGAAVWFDDITVREYDAADNLVRTVCSLSVDDASGWYFWSQNGSGQGSPVTDAGHSNNKCLEITGTTGDANYGNDTYKFMITQGHKYQISGWIKGDDVGSGATVRFRVDFYSATGDVHSWGKDYLHSLLDSYIHFSGDKNVPVYLGEFGSIIYSFQNNRGGLNWVTDMLDILRTNNVNYNYHTYHEYSFGLYQNSNGYPDPHTANDALIDLFTSIQAP